MLEFPVAGVPHTASEAKKLNLGLCHVAGQRGPIIGHVDPHNVDPGWIRVYAPAVVLPSPSGTVVFAPIFCCEDYIDINLEMVYATGPIPEPIKIGYEDYFKQFAAGAYKMKVNANNAEHPEGEG